MITDDELYEIFRRACAERGGQKTFADRTGYTKHFINDVYNKRRPITEKISRALGYEARWVKVKK